MARSDTRDAPPRRRRSFLQGLVYWGAVLFVWGLIFALAFLAVFAADLPDTSNLNAVRRQPSISYLDRSGALVSVRGSQYAPPVDLDKLPPYVPAAFVAIEDRWFYWHFGFNPWGIVRSQVYNLTHRGDGPLRGGSTITQQLARNLFLTMDQTYRRKAQELVLAIWLETKFTKKEILALYLNRVYFGAGAYGIEAAAQRYFGKPADQLSIGESALLAGMMKGPSRYSPVSSADRAARRATVVLNEMVRAGAITPAQRAEAIQVSAEQALRAGVAGARGQGVQQGALVALDGEGRVRAYVGGVDYEDSQFDRAAMARRQAGSAFKPFVYLTALERGRTPETPVVDEAIRIGTWEPRNYTGEFLGPITLQTALAQSVNTVAARLANEVGTGNVAATARRLGIRSPIQLDPSMALGAVEVSPLEMAQAYTPFSNGGYLSPAWAIERVRTAGGKVLYDRSVARPVRTAVISSPALPQMNQMLRQVLVSGTGTRARVPGYDLAGKTGTTSDYRDAWFVGYTGGFVAAVWVGRDDNTPMRRMTGGGAPAAVWQAFMSRALPRLRAEPIPGGLPPPTADEDPIGDILQAPAETPAQADPAVRPSAPAPSPAASPPQPSAAPRA